MISTPIRGAHNRAETGCFQCHKLYGEQVEPSQRTCGVDTQGNSKKDCGMPGKIDLWALWGTEPQGDNQKLAKQPKTDPSVYQDKPRRAEQVTVAEVCTVDKGSKRLRLQRGWGPFVAGVAVA